MSFRPGKRWTILNSPDEKIVKQLSEDIKVPVSLTKILVRRGITSRAEAKKFFVHSLDNLHNPFLMKGMEKASSKILQTIELKKPVLVFGDYDVDGTSGVAMFHSFLNDLGTPNQIFIPDRFRDGYGLSKSGIDYAYHKGIKLIIAIDCGITATDKVEYGKSLGIEIIICDHHQPPEKLPEAYAVLDPLQKDCDYPFKYLCGTGVAFKLIQAVCLKLNSNLWQEYIDYVAIATSADMVPVTGENRILIHHGFKKIEKCPRPSLKCIIEKASLNRSRITTSNVVFVIGPRINAVGRLGDATRAVKFLISKDEKEANNMLEVLENENANRKKIDSDIYTKAQLEYENYILNRSESEKDVAIILHDPSWHPGVLGIIAARMVEKYYRPSIILTTFNGSAKGSARSINNFNIYEAIKRTSAECSAVIHFGGHYHAAGVEIDISRIEEFREAFNRVARDIIIQSELGEDMLIPELYIDSELELREINDRFMKILYCFEPFGPENMMPVFLTKSVQVVGDVKTYRESTTAFKVRGNNQNKPVECIYYQSPESDKKIEIKTGDFADIVYSPEYNHFNGTRTQLRIRDIKIN